jgi:hypothetical protein
MIEQQIMNLGVQGFRDLQQVEKGRTVIFVE